MPFYGQRELISRLLDEYGDFMTGAKKPAKTRARKSALRVQLDKAQMRVAALEAAAKHWYVVAKTETDPCKQCGLSITDRIHRDSGRTEIPPVPVEEYV